MSSEQWDFQPPHRTSKQPTLTLLCAKLPRPKGHQGAQMFPQHKVSQRLWPLEKKRTISRMKEQKEARCGPGGPLHSRER